MSGHCTGNHQHGVGMCDVWYLPPDVVSHCLKLSQLSQSGGSENTTRKPCRILCGRSQNWVCIVAYGLAAQLLIQSAGARQCDLQTGIGFSLAGLRDPRQNPLISIALAYVLPP
eukprot:11561183-Prorocentrum_lima.AAC.1